MTIGQDRVDEPIDDATLVKLSLGSSPEIEERLTALAVPRSIADEDKVRLLAVMDAQEAQLTEWIESVRDARAVIEREPPSEKSEGR